MQLGINVKFFLQNKPSLGLYQCSSRQEHCSVPYPKSENKQISHRDNENNKLFIVDSSQHKV
jgi:hypothetical protein